MLKYMMAKMSPHIGSTGNMTQFSNAGPQDLEKLEVKRLSLQKKIEPLYLELFKTFAIPDVSLVSTA